MSGFWVFMTSVQISRRLFQPLPEASSSGRATRMLQESTRWNDRVSEEIFWAKAK